MALAQDARHSLDFASVRWDGVELSFSPMQAAIVKLLWEAAANGTPELHASTLLVEADSRLQENRLDPLFFRHPAWKSLIVRGKRRGTYRLDAGAFSANQPEKFAEATVVLQTSGIMA